MPYFWGVLTGILLTILTVLLIDNVDRGSRDFVNWDYVGETLGTSVKEASEKVREEVHDATAPEGGKPAEPAEPAPSQ